MQMFINMSRSKGNQAIKFCQLIEHNMRNNFFKKSHRKWGRKPIPKPFSKKSKLSISLDEYSKALYILS